jgi:hypothetical protein
MKILLGVGGIAAYKSAELARRLMGRTPGAGRDDGGGAVRLPADLRR